MKYSKIVLFTYLFPEDSLLKCDFFWLKVVRQCPNFHKLWSGGLKEETFRLNDTESLKGIYLKLAPVIEKVIPIIKCYAYLFNFCEHKT